MKRLVLIRHGQSEWNKDNRFTGWTDVALSPRGIDEAIAGGKAMREAGFKFEAAYTSYLKRAIKTLWLALEEMDLMYIPVSNSWRLNEKHYGMLTGLNKSETAAKYGDEQVLLWRRGFAIAPPPIDENNEFSPINDPKYKAIPRHEIPLTESLKDCINRLLPYWENEIKPTLIAKNEVLVSAHGNSLRGIVKMLKGMTEEEILELNMPTGIPYVFEFDDNMNLQKDYFLADEATLSAMMAEVANQGKK
ncbi:MAG: 2,3-diphosphoglycerate-dependent phosphoglycerate mutase [Flavobacteriales bacterium]|nr:2,3-diphosphoglycerate-dependent phosphoglycerate mutase [Flavobacteriales bacterium]